MNLINLKMTVVKMYHCFTVYHVTMVTNNVAYWLVGTILLTLAQVVITCSSEAFEKLYCTQVRHFSRIHLPCDTCNKIIIQFFRVWHTLYYT